MHLEQPLNKTQRFEQLFRSWYAPLVRYAVSITKGGMEEAEDLVQQVFAKYWEQQLEDTVQLSEKAYLYKMVYHQALNQLRKVHVRESYKMDRQRVEKDEQQSGGTAFDLQDQIRKAMEKLSPQCRQVFELNRFEELKYREIADHLGISIKTVESHMGKALKIMRQELVEFLMWLLIFLFF